MTDSNVLELAKLGDPQAIASLMNQSLESKGMLAKVERQGDSLEVTLEAERVPNRQALTAFVQKGINNLGIQAIRSVRIIGQQVGAGYPAWMQELQLNAEAPLNIQPETDPDITTIQSLEDTQIQSLEDTLIQDRELDLPADAESAGAMPASPLSTSPLSTSPLLPPIELDDLWADEAAPVEQSPDFLQELLDPGDFPAPEPPNLATEPPPADPAELEDLATALDPATDASILSFLDELSAEPATSDFPTETSQQQSIYQADYQADLALELDPLTVGDVAAVAADDYASDFQELMTTPEGLEPLPTELWIDPPVSEADQVGNAEHEADPALLDFLEQPSGSEGEMMESSLLELESFDDFPDATFIGQALTPESPESPESPEAPEAPETEVALPSVDFLAALMDESTPAPPAPELDSEISDQQIEDLFAAEPEVTESFSEEPWMEDLLAAQPDLPGESLEPDAEMALPDFLMEPEQLETLPEESLPSLDFDLEADLEANLEPELPLDDFFSESAEPLEPADSLRPWAEFSDDPTALAPSPDQVQPVAGMTDLADLDDDDFEELPPDFLRDWEENPPEFSDFVESPAPEPSDSQPSDSQQDYSQQDYSVPSSAGISFIEPSPDLAEPDLDLETELDLLDLDAPELESPGLDALEPPYPDLPQLDISDENSFELDTALPDAELAELLSETPEGRSLAPADDSPAAAVNLTQDGLEEGLGDFRAGFVEPLVEPLPDEFFETEQSGQFGQSDWQADLRQANLQEPIALDGDLESGGDDYVADYVIDETVIDETPPESATLPLLPNPPSQPADLPPAAAPQATESRLPTLIWVLLPLCIFIGGLLGFVLLKNRISTPPNPPPTTEPTPAIPAPDPAASPSSANPSGLTPLQVALQRADSAVDLGQTAQSVDDWKLVASRWQQSIQLLQAIPDSSLSYQSAQQKIAEYQNYLAVAQRKANQLVVSTAPLAVASIKNSPSPAASPAAVANPLSCAPVASAANSQPVELSSVQFDSQNAAQPSPIIGCITNHTDQPITAVDLAYSSGTTEATGKLSFGQLEPKQTIPFRSEFTVLPEAKELAIAELSWTAAGGEAERLPVTISVTRSADQQG